MFLAHVRSLDMSRPPISRIVKVETFGPYRHRATATFVGWFRSGNGRHPICKDFTVERRSASARPGKLIGPQV